MRANVTAECKDRRQIDLKHRLPILIWELMCWMPLLDATTVEQDVNSVPIFEDAGDE
jgi:hypothetical protein